MPLELQREFFGLAGIWLYCRQKMMLSLESDKMFIWLGEMDYAAEMGIIVKECQIGLHK